MSYSEEKNLPHRLTFPVQHMIFNRRGIGFFYIDKISIIKFSSPPLYGKWDIQSSDLRTSGTGRVHRGKSYSSSDPSKLDTSSATKDYVRPAYQLSSDYLFFNVLQLLLQLLYVIAGISSPVVHERPLGRRYFARGRFGLFFHVSPHF